MYCSKCGSQVADNAAFCGNCGERTAGPSLPPAVAVPPVVRPPAQPAAHYSPPPPGATYVPPPHPGTWPAGQSVPPMPGAPLVYVPVRSPFAGFWLRFVAILIDWFILLFGFAILVAIIIAFVGISVFQNAIENSDNTPDFLPASIIFAFIFAILGLMVGEWIYFAWMESSSYQGTVGKMALGLIVTDLQGRRISFARATGRFFSKFITHLIPLFIGYIMAGFTEKKQALHDMIASTLVLRKS